MPSRELRRYKNKKNQPASEADKTLPAERRRRHPVLYAGSIVLLVLIVIAFVGGPLAGGIGGGNPIVFGTYGGEEIRYVQGNYLARQVDILSSQIEESSNENYEWQAYQVWKGAYDRAVVRTAILQKAEKAGVHVSDNAIDKLLLTTGPYMENGVFSETRYRNTTNSERFRYRQLYRDEMIHQTYINDIIHNDFISTDEAEFFKNMAVNERSFFYVLFTFDQFPDSEVLEYAEENKSNFRKIGLSRITVQSSLEDAKTVRQKIIDGVSTFEYQARNFSTDSYAEEGGDMGWMEYHALASDFDNIADLDEIFASEKDEITEVYETSFGWVMYRIDEPAVEADFTDQEELDSVRSYMERFARGTIEDYLLENAESFAVEAQGSSFETAAESQGVDVKQSDSFPINYGNANYFDPVQGTEGEGDLSGSAYDATFLTTVFSLDEEEVSEPIVLDDSVGVFTLAEQVTNEDEELEYLVNYYPNLVQQSILQDLQDHIMDSDKFKDNFTEVFSEAFLSR